MAVVRPGLAGSKATARRLNDCTENGAPNKVGVSMSLVWNWITAPVMALASLPRTVAGLSLAGRIALCVAVFQILVVLLGTALLVLGDGRQVIEAWWRPGKLAVLAVLLVLTPALVYQAARLWLERDVSRFPDIVEAWQAALTELRWQGISPADTPLFLVLGAASDEEEERLLAEAPCEFVAMGAPQGAAALHVYGGPDAIFVCLATCARLSDIVRHADRRSVAAVPAAVPGLEASAVASSDAIRGTVMIGQAEAETPVEAAPPVMPAHVPPIAAGRNDTIDISQVAVATEAPSMRSPSPQAATADRREMRERLAYFCGLLRGARGGVAALNGIMAIVPGGRLMRGSVDPQSLGQALGDDVATVLATTGVRPPVVVVAACMESEPGFVEFIRRMPAAQRNQRVGQKFPTGIPASHDQLGSLAVRACAHVEDLITGRLFRAPDALSVAGNDRLATLLARLRGDLAPRLKTVLQRALLAPEGESNGMTPFVAGCYLVSSGAAENARGFIRGVFERFIDPDTGCLGDLEWTSQELAADEASRGLARMLWIFSGVVFAAVAAAVVWRLMGF